MLGIVHLGQHSDDRLGHCRLRTVNVMDRSSFRLSSWRRIGYFTANSSHYCIDYLSQGPPLSNIKLVLINNDVTERSNDSRLIDCGRSIMTTAVAICWRRSATAGNTIMVAKSAVTTCNIINKILKILTTNAKILTTAV